MLLFRIGLSSARSQTVATWFESIRVHGIGNADIFRGWQEPRARSSGRTSLLTKARIRIVSTKKKKRKGQVRNDDASGNAEQEDSIPQTWKIENGRRAEHRSERREQRE